MHCPLPRRIARIGAVIDVMTHIVAEEPSMMGVSSERPCSHPSYQSIDRPYHKTEDVDCLDPHIHLMILSMAEGSALPGRCRGQHSYTLYATGTGHPGDLKAATSRDGLSLTRAVNAKLGALEHHHE